MTIGYKDKCSSCGNTLTETTNEIAEEKIYEQFTCPYCGVILKFKEYYTWYIIAAGAVWILSTLGKYGFGLFTEVLVPYKETFEIISNISLLVLMFILWFQHIKVIK